MKLSQPLNLDVSKICLTAVANNGQYNVLQYFVHVAAGVIGLRVEGELEALSGCLSGYRARTKKTAGVRD